MLARVLQQFLVATNLWVGLSVGAFTYLSFHRATAQDAWWYSALVALATTAGYGYMRWVQVGQGPGKQTTLGHRWFLQNRTAASLILGLSLGLSLAILYFFAGWQLILFLIPALAVVLFYPITFLHAFHAFTSLRSLPGLKLLLISACWTHLTFVVPMWMQGQPMDIFFITETLLRTLFIAALTIPFDVRDLAVDDENLKTLPQWVGTAKALALAGLGLGLYQIWWAVQFAFQRISLGEMLAGVVALEVAYHLVKGVLKNRSEMYISFWIEAIPLLLALLVLGVRWLGF